MDNENHITKCTNCSLKSKFLVKYILSYCFYIHLGIFICLAIIQLRFSIVYKDHCTIDNRLTLYLFVISITEIIYSFNGIFLIIFSFFYEKYSWINYSLFIDFLIEQILLIFLIIWFIIGNYLFFHLKKQVQFTNSYRTQTYCHYSLYQIAYGTIIIYYILIFFFFLIILFLNSKWFVKQFKYLKNRIKTLMNLSI